MSDGIIRNRLGLCAERGKQDIVKFCQIELAGGTYQVATSISPNAILLRTMLPRIEEIQTRKGFEDACRNLVTAKNEMIDEDAMGRHSGLLFRAIGRAKHISAFETAAMEIKREKKLPFVNDECCDYVINLMGALKDEALSLFTLPGENLTLRPIDNIADLCISAATERSKRTEYRQAQILPRCLPFIG